MTTEQLAAGGIKATTLPPLMNKKPPHLPFGFVFAACRWRPGACGVVAGIFTATLATAKKRANSLCQRYASKSLE
jgi:hypothetical protein